MPKGTVQRALETMRHRSILPSPLRAQYSSLLADEVRVIPGMGPYDPHLGTGRLHRGIDSRYSKPGIPWTGTDAWPHHYYPQPEGAVVQGLALTLLNGSTQQRPGYALPTSLGSTYMLPIVPLCLRFCLDGA